jgi:hypothetical protein
MTMALRILGRAPVLPHERGPRGGLRQGINPRWRVECTVCLDVYCTTTPSTQIKRTPHCFDCEQKRRRGTL